MSCVECCIPGDNAGVNPCRCLQTIVLLYMSRSSKFAHPPLQKETMDKDSLQGEAMSLA